MTHAELSQTLQEGRLGDNLPKLVASKAGSFTASERDAIRKAALSERTGLFDSHPSDNDRIQRAQDANAPGIFRVDAPASVLFEDFEALSRRVTLGFYRRVLGEIPSASLVSTEEFRGKQEHERQGKRALARYTQALLSPRRMLPLETPELSVPGSSEQSLAELTAARRDFEHSLPEAKIANAQLGRAVAMQEKARLARCLLEAGRRA